VRVCVSVCLCVCCLLLLLLVLFSGCCFAVLLLLLLFLNPFPPPPLRPSLSSPCLLSHSWLHNTPYARVAALRVEKEALLDLLGEKDEELEALRSDLEDVKEAFRVQVDLLLEKLVGQGQGAAALAVDAPQG
jgi:hypothetical protein